MMPVSYLFTDESESRRNVILVVEAIDLDSTPPISLSIVFVLCELIHYRDEWSYYILLFHLNYCVVFVERRGEECYAYYNIKGSQSRFH